MRRRKIIKLFITLSVIYPMIAQFIPGNLADVFQKPTSTITETIENLATHPAEKVAKKNTKKKKNENANAKTTKKSKNSTKKTTKKSIKKTNTVKVTFCDVGQGDSILIKDNSTFMLIDTGAYSAYDNLQSILNENKVKKINTMVLTHPDADHIQSAVDIIEDYGVGKIYMPTVESDSKTYQYLMQTIKREHIKVIHPYAGDTINFGKAKYKVLGPVGTSSYSDTNSHSIIIKMTNGKDTFLFTGDATGDETEDMLAAGYNVSADVYKAAHHGSANDGCNEESFLASVDPEAVVISCGYQNNYGHPHRETMDLIQYYGLKLFRTDLQGTISCTSKGDDSIKWSQKPSTNYTNGNGF